MADLKISQLTDATTPLAGTEVLPIVQSGSTRQVSVANLTAGRTQTSNGVVQGTAGTGYNFTANTPAAGMTSQLLNWYEEGTWTPSVTPATGSITTLGTLSGTYIRIGRLVTLTFYIEIVNNGTGGGFGLIVTGLPFTPEKDSFGVCREMASTGTANFCWIDQPNARMIIQTFTAGYPANNGYVFEGTLTYPV